MAVSPSPTYCLRQDPAGQWYRIPFIYAYSWDEWCARAVQGDGGPLSVFADIPKPPHYATPVELTKILFEHPVEIG